MLQHVFIFGVVIPTLITILLFIGFLICWFKFNMKERLQKAGFLKRPTKKDAHDKPCPPVPTVASYGNGQAEEHTSNRRPPKPHHPPSTGQTTLSGLTGRCTQVSNYPPNEDEDNFNNHQRDYYINPMAVDSHPKSDRFQQPNSNQIADTKNNICAHMTSNHFLGLPECEKELVQQVFHFAHSKNKGGYKMGQSIVNEEDKHENEFHLDKDDSGDYGHFVPVSQLIKDPNLREHYQKAFAENSMKDFNVQNIAGSLVYANKNTQCSQECLDSVGHKEIAPSMIKV